MELVTTIEIPLAKAFEMIYVLHRIFGVCEKSKKYIYIDEFQDFSPLELNLIRAMFPASILNVFGDVNQCISGKGISKLEDIPREIYTEKFEIKENYRNAREITQYVKTKLDIDMDAYGLEGIQKIVKGIPNISMADDDRVAIILKGNSVSMSSLDPGIKELFNYYLESGEIVRGTYNVIPVEQVKGLEFEKVIVIEHGMDKNQFYVACTRAINELYVVAN